MKTRLRPGRVYRRSELSKWSKAVDRHVRQLIDDGFLCKVAPGVYYCPKKTAFGNAAADDRELVKAFLKDHRFLLTSPNAYNSLGVGTTQLYNRSVVYNHKRHGVFRLGGRTFDFQKKHSFPLTSSPEFLLVDLLNNLARLPEDQELVLAGIRRKIGMIGKKRLEEAVDEYGSVRTKKIIQDAMLSA